MGISKEGIQKAIRNGWQNTRRNTRIVMVRLPYVFLAAGIVLTVVSTVRVVTIRTAQKSQIAAELWEGDSGVLYRQISCFANGQPQESGGPDLYIGSDKSLNVQEIKRIHDALDLTVLTSFGDEEDSESIFSDSKSSDSNSSGDKTDDTESRVWIDAYSAQSNCSVRKPASENSKENTADINVTGVAGDYFLIHPMPLASGAYLSSDTPDTKKIVLDTELAFKLFGTYQVTGESVFIGEREYIIIGVVRHAATDIDSRTQGDLMRAYIPFSELTNLVTQDTETLISETGNAAGQPLSAADDSNLNKVAVTCYEAVLPNRISGIAMQNLLGAFETSGKQEKNFLFVDNTDRFSPLRLWDTVFPAGETAYERSGFRLPFWEASAEMAEYESFFWWCLLMTGAATVLGSCLTVYVSFAKKKYS